MITIMIAATIFTVVPLAPNRSSVFFDDVSAELSVMPPNLAVARPATSAALLFAMTVCMRRVQMPRSE